MIRFGPGLQRICSCKMAAQRICCLCSNITNVKAGGMRVSKKQENGPVEKNAKPPGKDKSRYYNAGSVHPCPVVQAHSAIVNFAKPQNMGVLVAEALNKMSHKIHAAALQVAHQKPQPTLEKFTLPKRIYIIQQPRKC